MTKNYGKKGRLQEMALQVVACKEVKRGAVGIIDLMNKGLRLLHIRRRRQPLRQVGIIDLMNKGLRLSIFSIPSFAPPICVGIIDLMNKGLRRTLKHQRRSASDSRNH